MKKRPRLRFGIRALLVATTLVAIPLAIYAYDMSMAARQIAIVKHLRANGGSVIRYEWEHDANWNKGERTYPAWMKRFLGEDGLYAVNTLFLESKKEPDELLIQASGLRRLRMLKLPGCNITVDSLQPLVKLHFLEWLDLFMTPADDECVRTISQIKSLKILDLRNTRITDACIDDILTLPNLTELLIVDTSLSDVGIERLRTSLPRCKLVVKY